MRRVAIPALVLAMTAMTGCTANVLAQPTPTADPSVEAVAEPTPTPSVDPTDVPPLPAGAFLQVGATAVSGAAELRVVLTVDEAVPLDDPDGEEAWAALQQSCPNAIASQLEVFPELQPVGVILSTVEAEGAWDGAPPFGVAPGGMVANLAEGVNAVPASDPVGMFGCSTIHLDGEGRASIASLVLGDPAADPDEALEDGLAAGLYGLEIAEGTSTVTWRDCVVQLSNRAERIAGDHGWVPPAEWGTGCLIGDPGEI